MRKGKFAAFIAAIALLLASAALADEAIIDGKTSDRVHLRAGRSTASESLGLYFTGTRVLCEAEPQGDWVAVTIGNQMGYMKAEYLLRGSMGSASAAQKSGVVNNPNGSWVNFRQGPSEETAVLTRLNNNTALTLLGETNTGWYYARTEGLYGYIRADLVGMQEIAQADGFPFRETTRWMLSSGVGAWRVMLAIQPDGSFTGLYEDSDMGETGPGYPNGTQYGCSFSGRLGAFTQVSGQEYRMTVAQVTMDGPLPGERTADGMRMVTQAFSSLEVGDMISIYLPGTTTSAVPEEYFTWVQDNVSGGALVNAGLYNRTKGQGYVLD
ncbi:MAG: SH3 domain-containing protein [Aristaeellaceae bacterium]